jgi:hypothetical protein
MNMLKNKEPQIDMQDLNSKLKIKSDSNDADFNKKRKNHYKNEFRKASQNLYE